MGRKTIYALVLIGVVAVVLIANTPGSKIDVDLVFTEFSTVKSLVFLLFTSIGVAIGVLLK